MKNLTITKKLMIPILILVLSLIVMFVGSFVQLTKITSLSEEALLARERAANMTVIKNEHISWVMELRDSIENFEKFQGETDPTKSEFALWSNTDEIKNLDNEQIQNKLTEFAPILTAIYESAETINQYRIRGDLLGSRQYYEEEIIVLLDQLTNGLDDLEQLFLQESIDAATKLKSAELMTKMLLVILLIITSVLGLAIAGFFIRQITGKLKQTSESLSRSANMVASASVQLADAGQQLSKDSSAQAASIEETSVTMEQTSSMVEQNAVHTKNANELSNEASVAAIEGSKKMKDMNNTMDELKDSSANIAKIIKVIDEIAFQTNMLALNAAVEAARAGDAGQGFAVVAEEVRNLAQKSAQAAKETSVIIDKNIELSDYGVIISDEVGYALDDITAKVNNIHTIMSEISVASEEQSKGTAQVTDAIGKMEKVVQSNVTTSEKSAAAAVALQEQSMSLTAVVGELTKLVKGSKVEKKNKDSHIKLSKPKTKTLPLEDSTKANHIKIVSPDDVIPLGDDDDF